MKNVDPELKHNKMHLKTNVIENYYEYHGYTEQFQSTELGVTSHVLEHSWTF